MNPKWAQAIERDGRFRLTTWGEWMLTIARTVHVMGWEAAKDLHEIDVSRDELEDFAGALCMCLTFLRSRKRG